MKPEVTAETNLNGKKTRAASVIKDLARIAVSAMELPLEEKVALRDDLTASINKDLKVLEGEKAVAELKYNEAKKLINGQ